jgi:PAS domain S-box-containing protein
MRMGGRASLAHEAPDPAGDVTHSSATTLQDIITALSTEFINLPADEIDGAITEALKRVGEFAGVDRAYVFLVDPDAARMTNTHEWCRAGITPQIANLQNVPVEAYEWCMSRILKREVLHIPRVMDLPDASADKDLLLGEEIQSLLAVPITSASTVIGLIGFDAVRREQRWPDQTIALLKIVGTIVGNAIERKRFDQALRKEKEFIANVIETAGTLVIVLAPEGDCLRVNRAFSELTGRSAEELSATGWHQVIPEDSREAARKALGSAAAGIAVQFEGLLLSRSGEPRMILWNGAVVRAADGKPEYVIVTGSDLTETRILREQVEQSRRLDSLGRVAATIAHGAARDSASPSPIRS